MLAGPYAEVSRPSFNDSRIKNSLIFPAIGTLSSVPRSDTKVYKNAAAGSRNYVDLWNTDRHATYRLLSSPQVSIITQSCSDSKTDPELIPVYIMAAVSTGLRLSSARVTLKVCQKASCSSRLLLRPITLGLATTTPRLSR